MEIKHINPRLLIKNSLAVKIIKVDSPTRFWVHLMDQRKAFKEMQKELNKRMNRKAQLLQPGIDYIMNNEPIAIREGQGWRRGLIIDGIEENGMTTVALRDWGRVARRQTTEIYTLENRFRKLGWQGIPCGLAHLRSTFGKLWSLRAKETIRILIEKQEGWINILGTLEDEAALVKLQVKNEAKNEIKIKEIMILLGYGEHCDDIKSIPEIEVPMSHENSWNITSQKEGSYTPMKTVSNNSHKQKRSIYYLKKTLRCVTALEDQRIYMSLSNLELFCDNCYQNLSANQKLNYTQLFPHNLVHKKSVNNRDKCTSCKKKMVEIKLTSNCRGCTEGYRRGFKRHLNQGWGIAIISTPDDNDKHQGDPSNEQKKPDN